MTANQTFMQLAIELATRNVANGGGPFGAVVVKDGAVLATAANMVFELNDPTAHAEVMAIRRACEKLGSYQLDGCDLYSSCEPCPMCLGAIYWARPAAVYYANTRQDAAAVGFDDASIYEEAARAPGERTIRMVHIPLARALESFEAWNNSPQVNKY